MFNKIILAASVLSSSFAFASDFPYGTYPGFDQDGSPCEVTFGSPAGYVNNYPGGGQGSVSLVRVQVFGEDFMILDKATTGPSYRSTPRFDSTQTGTHLQIDTKNKEAFVYGNGVSLTCWY